MQDKVLIKNAVKRKRGYIYFVDGNGNVVEEKSAKDKSEPISHKIDSTESNKTVCGRKISSSLNVRNKWSRVNCKTCLSRQTAYQRKRKRINKYRHLNKHNG